MKLFTTILEFIIYMAIVALLGAAYCLVIIFPGQAESIARISETMIPWVVILILMLLFNKGISKLLGNLAEVFPRIRRIAAGTTVAELDSQTLGSITLSTEQVDELRKHISNLAEDSKSKSDVAWNYFLRYVAATIFGSQFELLTDLQATGPKGPSDVLSYYNAFISRAPKDTNYRFDAWVAYLTSNYLMNFDTSTNTYKITDVGDRFIAELSKLGLSAANFNN